MSVVVVGFQMQSDLLIMNTTHACRGVGVTCGQLDMHEVILEHVLSLLLSPYFFTSESSLYTFPEIKKNYVLVIFWVSHACICMLMLR